jgi:hypothetical protein
MVPKVDYLNVNEIIAAQKQAIYNKIQNITSSTKAYPGLTCFKEGAKEIEAARIPGLLETGWVPEMEKPAEDVNPLHPILRQLLSVRRPFLCIKLHCVRTYKVRLGLGRFVNRSIPILFQITTF